MLRIDKIFVKIDQNSKLSLLKVRKILEEKLKEVASATNFKVEQRVEKISEHYEVKLELILEKPISLQSANKILNAFTKERIIIKQVTWQRKEYGAFRRGHLDILVF